MSSSLEQRIQQLQDIIGTDAGNRGMKALIVPGDLLRASQILGNLPAGSKVILLTGFPCCVAHTPPTETDGPPGTAALAQACLALGHLVTIITDDCNRVVMQAALQHLPNAQLETFGSDLSSDRLQQLARDCHVVVACERAGPARDGHCYTMRGTDMTQAGLIAPLHLLVQQVVDQKKPFLAIGDGGNEMGMGKVIDRIIQHIPDGNKIGSVIAADCLIAASVSNWGGYALAAGAALVKAASQTNGQLNNDNKVREWVDQCLPTCPDEITLLDRCVAAGCRDGVSGKMEATVDGMPLETSLQCLRDVRDAAMGNYK